MTQLLAHPVLAWTTTWLVHIAGRMPATEENLELYRRISETLPPHERARALNAVGVESSQGPVFPSI